MIDQTVITTYIDCNHPDGCDNEITVDHAVGADDHSMYSALALTGVAAGWQIELPYTTKDSIDYCPFHRVD